MQLHLLPIGFSPLLDKVNGQNEGVVDAEGQEWKKKEESQECQRLWVTLARGKEQEAEPEKRREGMKGRGEEGGQMLTPGVHRYWGSPGRHGLTPPKAQGGDFQGPGLEMRSGSPVASLSYPLAKGESFWLQQQHGWRSLHLKYHLTSIRTRKMLPPPSQPSSHSNPINLTQHRNVI